MSSFEVKVSGVYEGSGANRVPLGVTAPCIAQYGSASAVPAEVKGTKDCRYVIPRGEVEFDIKAQALALDGTPFTDFNGSVAFRVIPGDLSTDLRSRWALAANGEVTTAVRALHPYGEVRVWVEDAPPKSLFDGGAVLTDQLPPEPAKRTYASGASSIIYFADQTLQSLQLPGELDNRGSPFTGEFVVVGKDPINLPDGGTEKLRQTCSDDPSRNGRDALMVVTGLDPAGFFVTDISACRIKEMITDSAGQRVRTPEPPEPCWLSLADGGLEENLDGGMGKCGISETACRRRSECAGYTPGTFASMFIYNYNFPDGLDEGDLLFSISGSVQEFTSTTQMVFPAWTVAERVRRRPESEWNFWLQYARPYEINMRTCGQDNAATPFLTDALCGHNRRNLKMESLESGLVKLRRVRFPTKFQNCDFNANGSTPFFCDTNPGGSGWVWGSCNFDETNPESEADRIERECNQNCVIGMGENQNVICSEEATFRGFGQFVVEMTLPGPKALGLDDSLPLRTQIASPRVAAPLADGGVPVNASVRVTGYGAGSEVAITCTVPTRFKVGNAMVVAGETDEVVQPGQVTRRVLVADETAVAFQAIDANSTCTVGINAKTRINLITKDAIPELDPDCSETDPDMDKAAQCRFLRGAEFDVIGHLRHVQPARPRWVVIPRAADDLCCYPGPGLECPRPIRACPANN
jgi:hypothetical protein